MKPIFAARLFVALGLIAVASQSRSFAGSIGRLYYEDISTSSDPAAVQGGVTNLKTSAIFPNSPTFREQLDDFTPDAITGIVNGGLQGRDNTYTQFGTWIRGYLEAPVTGDFTFFIASDDNSELWLSTDHVATNAVRIVYESGAGAPLFSGARLSQRQSVSISLVKARKYYLEVFHKQGGGSASIQVGWRRPDGVQEIIPARHLAQHPLDPYLGQYDPASQPFFNFYGLNYGDLPASVDLNEHDTLHLEVDVVAAQPTTFQWYFNGNPIPGENLSYLHLKNIPSTYSGTFQFVVTNAFGSLTSAPAVVTITPDGVPPKVALVYHRGNSNGVVVTFSEPVSADASNPNHYALHTAAGTALPIASATLLSDAKSVQLLGGFGFQSGSNYVLTVSNILDTAFAPNLLSPNPTVTTFAFVPWPGTTYDFNTGIPDGVAITGDAGYRGSGSHDSSGYVKLTDAVAGQTGALVLTNRQNIDQLRLRFKTRIADAGSSPAEGFSINVAADLPTGTFAAAEEGYVPVATVGADRLVVSFDNFANDATDLAPSISVQWRGVVLTNVLTGIGGVPPLNNSGAWIDVDLNLRRGGSLSLAYGGVTVFTNLATGIDVIANARIGLAARTGAGFETHWFDDINVNLVDGEIGPVTLAGADQLGDVSVLENRPFSLSVAPSGASPFIYQWSRAGTPIPGETNRLLTLIATNGSDASYSVTVSNEFSGTISATGTVTILPDLVVPRLLAARGFAGNLSQIRLTFDEVLDPVTATNPATYAVTGAPITGAVLGSDGRTVTLNSLGIVANQLYLIKIAGLKDIAVAGNFLTTTATFVSEVNYVGEVLADNPVRYYRFNETIGSSIASIATGADPLSLGVSTVAGNPFLGVGSLVPNLPEDPAFKFTGSGDQRVIVPNGNDLNVGGPYDQKSYEFWFNADAVPGQETTGLAASAGLWEQGAAARGIAIYLWRNPNNPDPNQASLVFNAFDDAADGPGSPYGQTTQPAVYAEYPGIQVGQTYHVVGVLQGSTNATGGVFNGTLTLYVNGVQVAQTPGVGRTYNHSGDVQIARGNGLIHNGGSGTLGAFVGTLDEVSVYNTALAPGRVAAHFQAGNTSGQSGLGALAASRVDTRGNPNQVFVTFSTAVNPVAATNLANYFLKRTDGTVFPLTNATLLGGERTVALTGNSSLLVNSNYVLIVSNVTDQAAVPNALSPNPTTLPFTFAPAAGITSDFNLGPPAGLLLYGNASVTNAGGPDGAGFLKLTDAAANQNGAVLFSQRRDIDQVRLKFKARLSNASATPGEGFAVTIASDLPGATYTTPEEGYLPSASLSADRLIVSFDNAASGGGDLSPSITVRWRGVDLTNVITGIGGIPPLHDSLGNWTDVDINLRRGGRLSVSYGGVTVITNLATGIDVIANAQIGLAARTSASFETHWFDDFNINFTDGEIGPVGIGADSELSGITAQENATVRFSVVPTGTGPFTYQWTWNGIAISSATNRIITVIATTNTAGNYSVSVSNEFSGATSPQASLTIDTDSTPPSVAQLLGLAGSLNEIRVWFSEPVDVASATNLGSYSVTGLTLLSASLSADGKRVTIKTALQQTGLNYALQIIGVKDRSSRANALNTQVSFAPQISYPDEVLADNPARYWRFNETNGIKLNSQNSLLDSLTTAQATITGSPSLPQLGQPSLLLNTAGDGALRFSSANSNVVTVPNGSDINITTGPWTKKSVEFWFQPIVVPAPGATGTAAATAIYEQGAASRGLNVYLWRNPANSNPAQADLVFSAWNNVATDGAGLPWGATNTPTYVRFTVNTGAVYHVVGVYDGDTNLTNGKLVLYVNGAEVGRTNSVGRLFNHTGDIQIGRGNTIIHTTPAVAANFAFFDGVLDEFALFSQALTPERVAAHYLAGITAPGGSLSVLPPIIDSVSISGGNVIVTWSGSSKLERSLIVNTNYTEVIGATSPYSESISGKPQLFFRLKN